MRAEQAFVPVEQTFKSADHTSVLAGRTRIGRNNVRGEWILWYGKANACHGEERACISRQTTHQCEENDRHHQLSARRDGVCRWCNGKSRRVRGASARSSSVGGEISATHKKDFFAPLLICGFVKGYSVVARERVDTGGLTTWHDAR